METKNLTRWDEDGSLLRRMRRGDVAAFEEVCAAIEVPLFSYALRFVRNRAEAEDIVQETFLRLYRAARTGKLKTSPRAYAFSIAHNLAADAAHAKTVREMHGRLLEVMARDGDPMHDRFAADPLG